MARLGAQELQSAKTKQHGEKQVFHPVVVERQSVPETWGRTL